MADVERDKVRLTLQVPLGRLFFFFLSPIIYQRVIMACHRNVVS